MSSDTTGHKECDKRGNTNKESKKHNCNTSIGSEHQNNKMKGSHDGDGQITASDHQATASKNCTKGGLRHEKSQEEECISSSSLSSQRKGNQTSLHVPPTSSKYSSSKMVLTKRDEINDSSISPGVVLNNDVKSHDDDDSACITKPATRTSDKKNLGSEASLIVPGPQASSELCSTAETISEGIRAANPAKTAGSIPSNNSNTLPSTGTPSAASSSVFPNDQNKPQQETRCDDFFDPSSSFNMLEEQNDDIDPYMQQTRRKRFREKQRRLSIATSIERLSDVLLKVDPSNLIRHNNQLYFGGGGGGDRTTETIFGSSGASNSSNNKRRRHGGYLSPNSQNHSLNRTEIINYASNLIEKFAMEKEILQLKLLQYEHDLAALRSRDQHQQTRRESDINNILMSIKRSHDRARGLSSSGINPLSLAQQYSTSTNDGINPIFADLLLRQQQQVRDFNNHLLRQCRNVLPPTYFIVDIWVLFMDRV